MGANDRQVAGTHYQGPRCFNCGYSIEHWDVVEMFGLSYLEGQITKYVMRWKKKNGIEDLVKAQHYLEKLIEVEQFRLKGKEYVDNHKP